MIEFHPVNQLMMKSAIIHSETYPQPYKILRGKKNFISDLYTATEKFQSHLRTCLRINEL